MISFNRCVDLGAGQMTKADFADSIYLAIALVFLVLMTYWRHKELQRWWWQYDGNSGEPPP